MGDLAGHERRGTSLWPGRSAVLGLVAAALGILRDDAAGLASLESLSVSVSVLVESQPLRDYHTTQTVPTAVAQRPDSRPAAIDAAGGALNTTITQRDYRTGVAFGLALGGDGPLDRILEKLQRPAFVLYLGRKACPLSAPLAPRLVDVANVVEALAQITLPHWIEADPARPLMIAADGISGSETRIRHDVAIDRARWHFASREVAILTGPWQ